MGLKKREKIYMQARLETMYMCRRVWRKREVVMVIRKKNVP